MNSEDLKYERVAPPEWDKFDQNMLINVGDMKKYFELYTAPGDGAIVENTDAIKQLSYDLSFLSNGLKSGDFAVSPKSVAGNANKMVTLPEVPASEFASTQTLTIYGMGDVKTKVYVPRIAKLGAARLDPDQVRLGTIIRVLNFGETDSDLTFPGGSLLWDRGATTSFGVVKPRQYKKYVATETFGGSINWVTFAAGNVP